MIGHSVILTSYNRPTFIKKAIESVLAQTEQNFQLVIVDDGSTKETVESIDHLTKDDSRCILLRAETSNPRHRADFINRLVDRINEGLKRASGNIIHYLADDDFYDPHRFQFFDELFTNPDVMVGYGRLLYVDTQGHPTGETRYFETIQDPWNKLDHNQLAHRRSASEKVNGWSNGIFSDYAPDGHFFRKLRDKWDFHGTDKVVAYKRLHALNMQRTQGQTGASRE